MIVISTRDFRANQTKYMDMARNGEDVILKSRSSGSFKLTPVRETQPEAQDRDLTEELIAALRQVKDHIDGKIKLKTQTNRTDIFYPSRSANATAASTKNKCTQRAYLVKYIAGQFFIFVLGSEPTLQGPMVSVCGQPGGTEVKSCLFYFV